MANLGQLKYRGDDVAEDILSFSSPNDDLANLYIGHTGVVVHKWHHYFAIYTQFFERFRNTPVRFLEIGVSKGGSLELWRKYLGPDAIIFGIDIDPECAKFDGQAGHVRIGSQEDPAFLNKVIDEMGGVDVILDDGSHRMEHIPITLETLFPRLEDKGVYMIEDLHTSYWRGWGGGPTRKANFFNYLRQIIDVMHRHYVENEIEFAKDAGFDHVGGLHIFDSIAVLEKAPPYTPQHSEIGT